MFIAPAKHTVTFILIHVQFTGRFHNWNWSEELTTVTRHIMLVRLWVSSHAEEACVQK